MQSLLCLLHPFHVPLPARDPDYRPYHPIHSLHKLVREIGLRDNVTHALDYD